MLQTAHKCDIQETFGYTDVYMSGNNRHQAPVAGSRGEDVGGRRRGLIAAPFVLALGLGVWLVLQPDIPQPLTVPAATPSAQAAGAPASTVADAPDNRTELALAAALVDNLNKGDEDAVVALFDPEATLRADRYAWMHFEIRLWARTQIAASIEIEPEGAFQAVPNRALWTGRVRRADFREQDVEWVRVANQILTEGDRIMDFTPDPLEAASVTPLGNLWRPGSTPDRTPPAGHSKGVIHDRDAGQVEAPTAAALPVALAGVVVAGYVRLRRPRAPHPRRPSSLIAELAVWLRRPREDV